MGRQLTSGLWVEHWYIGQMFFGRLGGLLFVWDDLIDFRCGC